MYEMRRQPDSGRWFYSKSEAYPFQDHRNTLGVEIPRNWTDTLGWLKKKKKHRNLEHRVITS